LAKKQKQTLKDKITELTEKVEKAELALKDE